jgi:hypothetical protein
MEKPAMSTSYRPLIEIRACQLFDGRLRSLGIREHLKPDMTTRTKRCLTDGLNYLWANIGDNGFLESFTRWGFNDPSVILGAVAKEFDTYIASEHDPQYWGFETEEEWHAALDELNREDEDRFYADVIKFVSGEPNDIREGTIGEIQAKIAKQLVESDPELLLPAQRERLMKAVRAIYDRDHAVSRGELEVLAAFQARTGGSRDPKNGPTLNSRWGEDYSFKRSCQTCFRSQR